MNNQPILQVKNIDKSFGDVNVLKNISIDIEEGELVTFIGPSGSGKTTLLRVLGGFHPQTSGEVVINGESVDHLPPEKRMTGMVFQNYALFPHMTVYQNIEYGLKLLKKSKQEKEELIKDALSQVQLEGYEDRKPSELSGGQQQRVAIARCLVLKPKVLLLDEPLSNLDANLRMIMRDEIRRLKEELNLTIVFVTHDQEEALSISDRVLVLKDGEVQQLASPSEVYQYPANEFVANFVGHANIIKGVFEQEGKRKIFRSTEEQSIQFNIEPTQNNLENGLAILRPEMASIKKNSAVKGKLINTVYHGSYIRYFVQVGNQKFMIDDNNPFKKEILKPGQTVGIAFPKEMHVIPS
ncbi:ABC transporter ATP-binding protein [Bacillus sp. A301a_S52]|jgi:ABC-type Fe3+/spermidine/putrescine transport system ATPase subunit|nr:ABC transporter ATP-binding protein [Bacillus sp. A301a_S52]UJW56608.1 ABC transporter ATP-binding protein [Bacillus sp. A116_S68]